MTSERSKRRDFLSLIFIAKYYRREYNSGEQQYLSLESVSIATGQDGKKTETVLNKLNGKTLLCPSPWWEIWVHDFGQFHFMIQGSNKFLEKEKKKNHQNAKRSFLSECY